LDTPTAFDELKQYIPYVIGAATTLLGVLITHIFEAKKRKSEEKRWYAHYFLGRKVDALSNLYVTLEDCYEKIHHYGNHPSTKFQYLKSELFPRMKAFKQAYILASIYFNADDEKMFSLIKAAFETVQFAIVLNLPDEECPYNKSTYPDSREINWSWLNSSYNNAVQRAQELLNPKVLVEVEKFTF